MAGRRARWWGAPALRRRLFPAISALCVRRLRARLLRGGYTFFSRRVWRQGVRERGAGLRG